MELTNEEKVTKLLSQNEIIRNKLDFSFATSPYNLSEFLEKTKNEPSQYDERFIFIK